MTDYGLKPSLASYSLRFDDSTPSTSVFGLSQVQDSKDGDRDTLSQVDHQCEIASLKLRNRDHKQAIYVLRRAFDFALGKWSTSNASERPLFVRFASSVVRLQLAVTLSQLGRHEQAKDEALAVKKETDEVWRILTEATIEAEAADADGDCTRPGPELRSLIRHPPFWLVRAVELSIQCRLCLALELEYLLPDDQFEVALDEARHLDQRKSSGSSDSGQTFSEFPVVGLPKAALTGGQEVVALFHEAREMSQQLLPESEIRDRAMRAEKEARDRWQRRVFSKLSTRTVRHTANHSSLDSPELSIFLACAGCRSKQAQLAKIKEVQASRCSTAAPSFVGEASPDSTLSEWQSMTLSPTDSTSRSLAISHTEWAREAPPGDVFLRSLPSAFAAYIGSPVDLDVSSLKRHKGGKINKKAALSPIKASEPKDPNPFEDWKKSTEDVGRMNLRQRKLMSFHGIEEARRDIHSESIRFRQWMGELATDEESRLTEDRILFSGYGVRTSKKLEERRADSRKDGRLSPIEQRQRVEERNLFDYYSVSLPQNGVGLKGLRKLLTVSLSRSPHEQERLREEKSQALSEQRRATVACPSTRLKTREKPIMQHSSSAPTIS